MWVARLLTQTRWDCEDQPLRNGPIAGYPVTPTSKLLWYRRQSILRMHVSKMSPSALYRNNKTSFANFKTGLLHYRRLRCEPTDPLSEPTRSDVVTFLYLYDLEPKKEEDLGKWYNILMWPSIIISICSFQPSIDYIGSNTPAEYGSQKADMTNTSSAYDRQALQ